MKLARHEVVVTIDYSEHTTIAETDFTINGIIRNIAAVVPALTGTATTITLKLEDEDDIEWYSKGSIAEGATAVVKQDGSVLEIPIMGLTTAQVTASAAQGADVEITLVLLYEQN